MLRRPTKASFFRNFLGGFAIGAVGILAVQVSHADEPARTAPPVAVASMIGG